MHLHRRSIRARTSFLVLVPVLPLIALYAYATAITAHDDAGLTQAMSIRDKVVDPIGSLTAQVQAESLAADTYLALPTSQAGVVLVTQEAKTDRVVSAVEASLRSARDSGPTSTAMKADITALFARLAGLPRLRREISPATLDMAAAQDGYSAIASAGYQAILQTAFEVPNTGLAAQTAAFMGIAQAGNLLRQEQALLLGDMTTGSFTAADHAEFGELVGEHRELVAENLPVLAPPFRGLYRYDVSQQALAVLTTSEDAVTGAPPGAAPQVSIPAYRQAATAVAVGLGAASYQAAIQDGTAWHNAGRSAFLRLLIVGGGGLIVIIISIVISLWAGRGLVRQLTDMRLSAVGLASVRLRSRG
ncbi:MAG TPA: nitrate- and nitrite sensing domain-containing protein [Streptosporangiaceae bacterium]|nr:nitrate- and nitrite sensing domain-containing protein [Streptosporangiaceae bacterium]